MDEDVLKAALTAIVEQRAGEVHPAVLKQVDDEGFADCDTEPPELTQKGIERLRELT